MMDAGVIVPEDLVVQEILKAVPGVPSFLFLNDLKRKLLVPNDCNYRILSSTCKINNVNSLIGIIVSS